MCTVRSCSSFMTVRRGDKPLVMCSGWSEKALRKPFLFFSRYRRTMNASADVGVTLVRRECGATYLSAWTYLSACRTRMPVMR